MSKGKPIDPALKSEIVSKIRNDGMTVSAASAHYGVNSKSIYYCLRDGVVAGNRNLILENNKLKKRARNRLPHHWPVYGRVPAPKRLAALEEVEPGWRDKFARVLGVCRTSYYRTASKQAAEDARAVAALLVVHAEHPFYGVRRLALHLGWSQKKTRRIRTQAGIVIPTLSKKRRSSSAPAEIAAAPNALKRFAVFRNEARPGAGQSYRNMTNAGAWVQDFTHLRFRAEEHYLAVVLDLKTRQVVGWRLGTRHTSELTLAAVLDALSKHPSPAILHSDQGSEYLSYKHQELCQRMEITLSCSKRASPWQNGFMERWFGNFKLELGNLNRHGDLARFHEAVAMAIYYYNHERIHLSLKMSPAAYAARLKEQNQRSKSLERVLQETGA